MRDDRKLSYELKLLLVFKLHMYVLPAVYPICNISPVKTIKIIIVFKRYSNSTENIMRCGQLVFIRLIVIMQ